MSILSRIVSKAVASVKASVKATVKKCVCNLPGVKQVIKHYRKEKLLDTIEKLRRFSDTLENTAYTYKDLIIVNEALKAVPPTTCVEGHVMRQLRIVPFYSKSGFVALKFISKGYHSKFEINQIEGISIKKIYKGYNQWYSGDVYTKIFIDYMAEMLDIHTVLNTPEHLRPANFSASKDKQAFTETFLFRLLLNDFIVISLILLEFKFEEEFQDSRFRKK